MIHESSTRVQFLERISNFGGIANAQRNSLSLSWLAASVAYRI